jgi:hypothetical protein
MPIEVVKSRSARSSPRRNVGCDGADPDHLAALVQDRERRDDMVSGPLFVPRPFALRHDRHTALDDFQLMLGDTPAAFRIVRKKVGKRPSPTGRRFRLP